MTFWVPHRGRRGRGRPSMRWVDEIKTLFGPSWVRKAKDKVIWKGLVKAYARNQVAQGELSDGRDSLTE